MGSLVHLYELKMTAWIEWQWFTGGILSLHHCTSCEGGTHLYVFSIILNRNNFIRLCILRVAQQSEKHLDKIFTVEQFIRRIFGVIHSNDPVARAITLRYVTPKGISYIRFDCEGCMQFICCKKTYYHYQEILLCVIFEK